MEFLRRWVWRVRRVFGRSQLESEMADEVRYHLEKEIEELIRRGLSPKEAQRSAYRRFGGVERFREQAAEVLWGGRMVQFGKDLRYAHRAMVRNPLFSLVLLLTIGLGVGASTAIYSVVDVSLLRPLPYGEPDRLVRIWNQWEGVDQGGISPAEYIDYRRGVDGFRSLGFYSFGDYVLTRLGDPARVRTVFTAAETFEVLAIPPLVGRYFTFDEAEADARVVVLSEGFWTERMDRDPDVIGRTLTLDGRAHQIVGVMPERFKIPEQLISDQAVELFVPLGITAANTATDRGSHYILTLGRLEADVSLATAAAELRQVSAGFVTDWPDEYPVEMNFTTTAFSLRESILGPSRPVVLFLFGSVGLLLLVACANVTGLLIARDAHRRREFDLRRTLGAGDRRLVGQLLLEGMVFAFYGGMIGLAFGIGLIEVIHRLSPVGIPRVALAGLGGSVSLFGLLITVCLGLFIGLIPALGMVSTRALWKPWSTSLTGGRGLGSGARVRRTLVMGEVAVALVLLVGAGLLGRSFYQLSSVDPGFEMDHMLTAEIDLPTGSYASDEARRQFYRELVANLEQLPGVEAVGAVSGLPLASGIGDLNFRIEDRDLPEGSVSPRAEWRIVTPGYFDAIGIEVLYGRGIERQDGSEGLGAVVISSSLAETYWPGKDALGARFELGGGAGPGMVTVVGIVNDVRHQSLDDDVRPTMYLPHSQFRFWNGGSALTAMTFVLKSESTGRFADLPNGLRRSVAGLDSALPVNDVRWMDSIRARSLSQPRTILSVLLLFSGLSLVLAGVGVYGITAFSVGRRASEFGLRQALGARPKQIIRMVLREGAVVGLVGVVLGMIGALLSNRALANLLYDVSTTDLPTILGVGVILFAVVLLASYLPARKAGRIDPARPLREGA